MILKPAKATCGCDLTHTWHDGGHILGQTGHQEIPKNRVQLHFYVNDFTAAFDTVLNKAPWKIMTAIGIYPRMVCIKGSLYIET